MLEEEEERQYAGFTTGANDDWQAEARIDGTTRPRK